MSGSNFQFPYLFSWINEEFSRVTIFDLSNKFYFSSWGDLNNNRLQQQTASIQAQFIFIFHKPRTSINSKSY